MLLLQEFDVENRDKVDVENIVINHLSRLPPFELYENNVPIYEALRHEPLLEVVVDKAPWFVDMTNFLACGIIHDDFTTQKKKWYLSRLGSICGMIRTRGSKKIMVFSEYASQSRN